MLVLTIDDCNRINVDQIVGRQGRNPHHDVGRLVIPEQCHPSLFDDRVLVIALVDGHLRLQGLARGRSTRIIS